MAGPDRRPARPARLRHRGGARRGIALVLVLWVLTLLTVMAVGMTAAGRTETALTENLIAQARFGASADAAIAYAVFSFMAPPPAENVGQGSARQGSTGDLTAADDASQTPDWVPDGSPRPWDFDGNALSIAVFNEQSRINLNEASAQVLSALLAALGAPEQEAQAIADAIVDWRDEDDLKLLNGAEASEYESAGRALGPKNAPFVAVEELQQVLGVNREVYQHLAPEVTVDTEGDVVDLTFASAAVIAAQQGIALADAQLQVEQRAGPGVPGAQAPPALNRGGPIYRIQIKEQGAATARTMEALVSITPGGNPPYQVRWRRFGLMAPPPPSPNGAPTG
ncbi:type II secretion system protein GspK [uncultured Thiodictyon sp.]|uniref:general secretion pathway protein GspK n=1 Tax=uncultured Thiodictyon sp. TaxID=1846217 RepID=UPI0025CF22F6|nr:type II secretion system protein GspK [uncultured Thiodictyon sp.]